MTVELINHEETKRTKKELEDQSVKLLRHFLHFGFFVSSFLRGFKGGHDEYGHFYLTNFTLKLERDNGGGLELLWTKEDGRWQIVSYDILEP